MNRRDCLKGMLAGLALAGSAAAQPLPGGGIRIVVGFLPGGGTDVLARLLGQKLGEKWGVPVVVENRAGAAGVIAADYVAKQPADGRTLLMAHINSHGIAPGLQPRLGYAGDDFTPIALVGATPLMLICGEKQPVRDLAGVVDLCRKNPGRITFGSAGTGSIQHLALELFKARAGMDAIHVPYKGGTSEITDLIAGHIDYCFEGMTTAAPQIQAGKVHAIAQTSPRRSKNFPDLPTVAELGYPGYEATVWFGLVGPAKLPAELARRMNEDVNEVLRQPDVAERLAQFGAEDGGGSAERFGAFMHDEQRKWAGIIRDARISPES